MTNDLIGIENDQSQIIIDREAWMSIERERHKDLERNQLLNAASRDLWEIVSSHDPEAHHLGNRVWDRLDRLALEIELHILNRRTDG